MKLSNKQFASWFSKLFQKQCLKINDLYLYKQAEEIINGRPVQNSKTQCS